MSQAQAAAQNWQGVAAENVEDLPTGVATMLRARSRRLLGSLLRPHRGWLALSAALILVRTGTSLSVPALIGIGIDWALARRDVARLEVLVAVIAALVVASAASQFAFLRITGRIGQDVLYDIRIRLFAHVQRLSLQFYESYTSGRIIARLTSDIDTLYELLATGLVSVVTSTLSLLAIAVILLTRDLQLGLACLAAFPFVAVFARWFRNQSGRAYRAVRQSVALVIIYFTESLGGIRAAQAYRWEGRNRAIFEDLTAGYRDANIWSSRLAATFGPGVSLLGRITTAGVILYGGFLMAQGRVTIGVLVAFVLYLGQFFAPMQDLSQFYNVFQAAAAALEKIAGVLEEEPTVPEPEAPIPLGDVRGRIEFDGVTFAYREHAVLHDVRFDVPAGQVVALVGETGAGKSTIARLTARFYDPQLGQVRLDGVDLRQVAGTELRRAVVMVTQESFLFGGTVGDNIAFGRPGATRAEVEAAAAAIGAHDFIAALPDGYDTDVRRRGVRLSSGQRQLVAFARAFLADPRVLILDEATSSLDLPSERLVQAALRTLLRDRTAFIIAHRLSTVDVADRVLVIEAGRVAEDGSPAELKARPGHYGALHLAWLESLA